jgi:hypothetical protein
VRARLIIRPSGFSIIEGSTSSNWKDLPAPEIARGGAERQELCRKTVKHFQITI